MHNLPHQRTSIANHQVLKIRLAFSLEPGSKHSREQREENAGQNDEKPSSKQEARKAEKSEAKGGEGELRRRDKGKNISLSPGH